MSGFEVFNNSGATTINSDQRHTIFDSIYTPNVAYVGDYDVQTPFGNVNSLGYINVGQGKTPGFLHWIQFTSSGAFAFPGSDLFQPGTVRVIRTSYSRAPESGYLDVFDSGGNLIWSAKSAATMPRIIGFLSVDGGYNLTGNVVSVTPGFNPFFLWEACSGAMDTDGVTSGYTGNLVRWTGSQLQTTWINRNQKSFNQIFQGTALRIPYARFMGYN